MGNILITPVKIHLKDKTPVIAKPYPISTCLRDKVSTKINTLLKIGVIQPSTSRYAAPAFFSLKKDGSIRILIDFRELNKKIYDTPGCFPTIYEDLDLLKGMTYFSKLDLKMGYYQIPINKEDTSYYHLSPH